MTPRFPLAFLLTLMDRIPTDFHRQVFWGLLLLALTLQAGETIVGLVSFPPDHETERFTHKIKMPQP